MCQTVSPCVASNQEIRQEESKTAKMSTGDLVNTPSHPPTPTVVSSPLPYPNPEPTASCLGYNGYSYEDDKHCVNDDDEHAGEDGAGLLEEEENEAPPLQEPAPKAAASFFSMAKLSELREKLAGVDKARAVVTGLSLVSGAVGAYFLLPAAGGAAAVAATMKAPGAAGLLISRAAFLANPQLYFQLLRTVGPRAAVAAFAL